MNELIKIIKSISHENRLRILNLLKEKQLCVCELKNIMQLKQSNISRHLNKLKQTDLVRSERQAQWIYYELNEEMLKKYNFLEKILEEEIEQLEICQSDLERLGEYVESDIDCSDLSESNLF